MIFFTLRPSNSRTPLLVTLTHTTDTVYAKTPQFFDGLGDVLKGIGYKWDRTERRWYRELISRHGAPEDRLIETAINLLAARFPVNVPSEDLRRRIAESDYTPEKTRWILARIKGERAGQLVAQWSKSENFRRHLHQISGVKAYDNCAYFPPELWDVALDFAQMHDFGISESAQRIIDDAVLAYESAYVVDVESLPKTATPLTSRPTLTADEFDIDEDLADDLADNN